MEKPKCSDQWTPEERLKLIAWYAYLALSIDCSDKKRQRLAEICYLVSCQSKEFLELNRKNIETVEDRT